MKMRKIIRVGNWDLRFKGFISFLNAYGGVFKDLRFFDE